MNSLRLDPSVYDVLINKLNQVAGAAENVLRLKAALLEQAVKVANNPVASSVAGGIGARAVDKLIP